jgi:hypothetical protein
MLTHAGHRHKQIAGGLGLYDVTSGAGIERPVHHFLRIVLTNHQNFAFG